MSTHGSGASGRRLRLLSWSLYIDPACLVTFERETGIGVDLTDVESDHDSLRLIRSGEPFDVALTTNFCSEVLIDEGLAQPLDMARLPNFAGVTDPRLRSPVFDPGAGGVKYTTVNYWGTMGFCVHLARVNSPVNSWKMLFDEAYRGRITMFGDAREVFAAALYLLGSDCNCTDRAVLDQATDMLIAQRPLVSAYSSGGNLLMFMDQGAAVVSCWNGEVAYALAHGATDIAFMLPQEGFNLWMDAPFIPMSATDTDAAYRFLDFLMRPDVAAGNGDFSGYLPVVEAAEARLKSLLQRSLRPLDTQMPRGVFQRDVGAFQKVYDEAFRRILET